MAVAVREVTRLESKEDDVNAASVKGPYEAIIDWSNIALGDRGIPTPETLRQVRLALHAIEEFLLEPIAQALESVSEEADSLKRRIPEGKRLVSYEDIGRLTIWADELRGECGYLLDTIADITLRVREDFSQVAEGYRPDLSLIEPDGQQPLKERLRVFYGLDHTRAW